MSAWCSIIPILLYYAHVLWLGGQPFYGIKPRMSGALCHFFILYSILHSFPVTYRMNLLKIHDFGDVYGQLQKKTAIDLVGPGCCVYCTYIFHNLLDKNFRGSAPQRNTKWRSPLDCIIAHSSAPSYRYFIPSHRARCSRIRRKAFSIMPIKIHNTRVKLSWPYNRTQTVFFLCRFFNLCLTFYQ